MNRQRPFGDTTPAVKIIIAINVVIFLLINLLSKSSHIDLVNILGLHLPESKHFAIYQYITHMFTQAGLTHLFFNMFAVYMFGRILESVWGTKRFLLYYLVTGLGAALLHSAISWYGYHNMQEAFYAFQNTPEPGLLADFIRKYEGDIPETLRLNNGAVVPIREFIDQWISDANLQGAAQYGESIYKLYLRSHVNNVMIGASGAVFGILLAFGMLFPNTELFLMFIPIPIKAKYFVLIYGAIELYMGLQNQLGDNIAHFAHLGGMLFGFFLIIYWRKHSKHFY